MNNLMTVLISGMCGQKSSSVLSQQAIHCGIELMIMFTSGQLSGLASWVCVVCIVCMVCMVDRGVNIMPA